MIKKIIKILSAVFLILILIIIYLSTFGIKTTKLNKQIKNKISEANKEINLELKEVKMTLSPSDFKVDIRTLDTEINFNNKKIKLASIKTKVSLLKLFNKQFLLDSLKISSKSIKAENFVSLIRSLKNDPKLLLLEMMIKDGYVKSTIDLNFDQKGKIKNNYKINGSVKNLEIKKFNDYHLKNINFTFDIEEKKYKFLEIETLLNKIKLNSPSIIIKEKNNLFSVKGRIINNEENISFGVIENLLNNYFVNLDLKNLNFVSDNNFSFDVGRKLKFSNININSEININKLTYKNKFQSIKKYFPEIKELIDLKDHKIKLNYNNNKITIIGAGQISIEDKDNKIEYQISKKNTDKVLKLSDFNINSEININKLTYKNKFQSIKKYFPEIKELIDLKDHKIKLNYNNNKITIIGAGQISIEDKDNKIEYQISKKDKKYFFKNEFKINKNIFLINELKYYKGNDKKALIKIDGILNDDNNLFFNEISLVENNNKILIKNLNLNNKFKIFEIGLLKFDYEDRNKIYNQINLQKNKKNYSLKGSSIDASKIINKIMNSKDGDSSIFSNLNSKIIVNIKKIYIDEINYMKNLTGNLNFKDNKINDLNLKSNFYNNKKFNLSIKTNSKKEKITKLFTDYPKPLIKRYDFIKGFEEGYLDYYSLEKNGVSNSSLVIDNFKVKEVPVFAKILSLASLQGIADLLTGEGIRFTDFEMKFSNNNKGLTTIEEMYAIGPAVSILMDGYIESKKLVSLRGTLVPATTINRSIASIPIIGDILVGKKTGEGVFGVSFKIKGPPKNLKTTVNPVKTLTPRFITRTLEKFKSN